VWWVALVIPLLLRVFPLRWVLRLLAPPRWWRPYAGMAPGRIAEAVARRLARPRMMRRRACLREGLLLFHFLCLAGGEPTVHFAVFPPDEAPSPVHAHCWVTLGGRAWSEPPQGPSVELMRYTRREGAAPLAGQR
jgi:hypothetical protein